MLHNKLKTLLILMMCCVNVCLFLAVGRFVHPYMTLNVSGELSSAQNLQIGYTTTEEITAETLKQQNFTHEDPQKPFSVQMKIPADIRCLRIDLEDRPDETLSLTGVTLTVLDQEYALSDLNHPMFIEHMDSDENGTFISNDIDPYVIYQFNGNEVYSFWKSTWTLRALCAIAVCVIMDLVLFALWRFGQKHQEIRSLIAGHSLIWSLAKRDFKTKYAGSYLGIFWAFFQPIVTILLYWFVFEVGFRSAPANGFPFVLWLICGLVPWFMFSDGITAVTSCLLEYNYLVKKLVFNIKLLPFVKIISALFVHLFFISFTLILFLLNGYGVSLYMFQVVYYLMAMLAMILALGLFTSSVVVFFRDLGQIVQIFLQIGVWMTPIMWNIDMISPKWHLLFQLNPLYYIVDGYRDCFINQVWFWEKPVLTIYYWVLVVMLLYVGSKVFEKLRVHFADVL